MTCQKQRLPLVWQVCRSDSRNWTAVDSVRLCRIPGADLRCYWPFPRNARFVAHRTTHRAHHVRGLVREIRVVGGLSAVGVFLGTTDQL